MSLKKGASNELTQHRAVELTSLDDMSTDDPVVVPYLTHTNRELEFMLERGKPLAHFSDWYPPEPDEEVVPRIAFAPYVATGFVEMRSFVQLDHRPAPPDMPQLRGSLHVFYARPAEAWRIDAYIAMIGAAAKAGWSEGFERLEGTLLGYTESQNDIHIETMIRSPHADRFPWLKRLRRQRGLK